MKPFFKGNLFDRTRDKREQDAGTAAPPEPKKPEQPSNSDFFYGTPDDLRKKRKPK